MQLKKDALVSIVIIYVSILNIHIFSILWIIFEFVTYIYFIDHDIGKSLNYSVDPCEDFYSFTCSSAQKTIRKNIDENLMNVIKSMLV